MHSYESSRGRFIKSNTGTLAGTSDNNRRPSLHNARIKHDKAAEQNA